ncbi:MAG: tetratricopeptide repeat protein [Methanoregula sp.]|jgi:tetratricopeptide (TPR) repeat protein|nr:tetratricopeptide repeat protein [Methanoregula sp.]
MKNPPSFLILPMLLIVVIMTIGYVSNSGDDANEPLSTANTLFDRGDYEEAITYYEKAIGSDPDNTCLQHQMTVCLCHLNKYAGALQSMNRELELNTGDKDATLVLLLGKTMVLSHLNQPEEAKKTFGEYLLLDPGDGSGFLKLFLLWKTNTEK